MQHQHFTSFVDADARTIPVQKKSIHSAVDHGWPHLLTPEASSVHHLPVD
jgi:hypothetical protein